MRPITRSTTESPGGGAIDWSCSSTSQAGLIGPALADAASRGGQVPDRRQQLKAGQVTGPPSVVARRQYHSATWAATSPRPRPCGRGVTARADLRPKAVRHLYDIANMGQGGNPRNMRDRRVQ